ITFNYAEPDTRHPTPETYPLHGEIFISIDDAITQARQFRTTWQNELVRYVIHGIQHLQGFDDLQSAARQKMNRKETRLIKEVSCALSWRKLPAASKLSR